jgi:hypothetical protein
MASTVIERIGKRLSSPLFLAVSLLLLAFLIRIIGIGDAALRTDEIYHLLAGRSWADHGTLAMGDGVYTRARYYSIVTGWFFELFGPTPGAGRAVAAVAGTALVVAQALWVRSVGNAVAAWTAGLLLCFSYTSITLSQFARFYTAHALGVFLFAIAIYAIVTMYGSMRRTTILLWSAVAIVALVVSLHLQAITALVMVAVACWAGVYLLLSGRLTFMFRSQLWLGILAIGVLAGIGGAIILRSQLMGAWEAFRGASAWSLENRDDVMFYVTVLDHWLGWLFALVPIAAILAWRDYRQPVLFCLMILAVCFTLHSFAGMKALRYVFYFFPFIFAIWGFAVASVGSACLRYVANLVPASTGRLRPLIILAVVVIPAALAFVVMTDFRLTVTGAVRMLKTGSPAQPFDYGSAREEVDWMPHLQPLRALQKSGLFVATDSVRTLYYLQDYDVLLGKSELSDIGTREFTLDKRTGKQDISTGRSVEQIVNCYPSGAIIVSNARWRTPNVTDEAADMIERITQPVALPPDLNMRAYRWKHPAVTSPACDRIHALIGKPRSSGS